MLVKAESDGTNGTVDSRETVAGVPVIEPTEARAIPMRRAATAQLHFHLGLPREHRKRFGYHWRSYIHGVPW